MMPFIHRYTIVRILVWFTIVFIGRMGVVSAQDGHSKYTIYTIEAGYIYNFIDFVNWPETHEGPQDTLIIGILGEDRFGDAFGPVEGSAIGGKTLSVRKSDRVEELMNCSIIYITSSERPRLKSTIETLRRRPILTVSNMEEFTQNGGMVQFYTTEIGGDIKVRFDINKDRADEAGLKMSFRLLSLARPQK